MQIVRPDAETERFNRELDSVGVVVRHVVIDGASAPSDPWEHRRAIVLALEAETEEWARRFPTWASAGEGVPLVNYLKANAMTGTRINSGQFLGPLWDARRQSLILRGRSPAYLSSYFVGDDEEMDANVVTPPPHIPDDRDAGYVYAFTDPPYPLRLTRARVIELFAQTLRRFLPALHASDSTLYQWPTDWSRYFDAGHDWWGSFAWTYGASSSPGEIVAIFASTSD